MADDTLVVVGTFNDRIEADLAQSALEAAGIPSMVRADDAEGTQPGLWMGNGVDVLVNKEDASRAEEVLNTPAQPEDGDDAA
jgi:hypothetical protein